jgi:histidinol dehydrogenase
MSDIKTTGSIAVLKGQDAVNWVKQIATIDLDDRSQSVEKSVKEIISLVRESGDAALVELAAKFKDPAPRHVHLDAKLLKEIEARLPESTTIVLNEAAKRIRAFAQTVVSVARPVELDCGEYTAGLDFKPVERVACYIPAGRYPLPSTALMTAVTAQVAGVKEICILSPSLIDEILYAGSLAGVTEFHEVGGAQAVAAATYGTASIRPVDMIVGPGNSYVTEAKRQVFGRVGIDMIAGPSEIAIVADGTGNPTWIALDLLAQAEHDPSSRVYLFTDSETEAVAVAREIEKALEKVDYPDYIKESLAHSALVVLDTLDACISAANTVAPEHLQVHVKDPIKVKPKLKNYGALFLGYHSTVPYGDYMAGPNHTLPTSRAARFAGGLNPFTFLRQQSWLKVEDHARELPKLTREFANLEGLVGHAAAAAAREK